MEDVKKEITLPVDQLQKNIDLLRKLSHETQAFIMPEDNAIDVNHYAVMLIGITPHADGNTESGHASFVVNGTHQSCINALEALAGKSKDFRRILLVAAHNVESNMSTEDMFEDIFELADKVKEKYSNKSGN